MSHNYFVYIMASCNHQVIYTGVTNNLERRTYEHQNFMLPGFTSKYDVTKLVYFEATFDIHAAIAREKQIKGWRRSKKEALINESNPQWNDLSHAWQADSSLALGMT